MKTTPPVPSLPIPNNEAVKALFRRKSLLERLMPVLSELLLTIEEKKDARQKRPLPDYCYNILQVLRKTFCKILPEPQQATLDGADETDWNALGKLIGAGLRCLRFGEAEIDAILKREGLPLEEAAQVKAMMGAMPCLCEKTRRKDADLVWETFLAANKSAHQHGLKTLTQLGGAIEKGLGGFIDENGQCVGESSRANIYWFLLLVWPEIQEMQQAHPPISRKDFAAWLQPFVRSGLVSIGDFDQLLDVCDGIGLKFKGRGAPRTK